MNRVPEGILTNPLNRIVRAAVIVLAAIGILLCPNARAIPSFASQTGMPCARCHTLAFGPALTEYGREFKLNGYTWGDGDHPMPIALMVLGGLSHSDAPACSGGASLQYE